MKKRIFVLMLCLLMIVGLFAACGGSSAVEPTRGVWDGYVFTSEYLGLHFVLPPGWSQTSDAHLAVAMGLTAAAFENAGSEMPDGLDSMLDMMANSPGGASVQIRYIRGEGRRAPTIEQLMRVVTDEDAFHIRVDADSVGTVKLGNYEWDFFDSEMELMGITIPSRQLFHFQDGFLRQIAIVSAPDGSESAEDILAWFVGLDEPLPERPVAEHAEELLGAWIWDSNQDWIYEFFADGTGIRGVNQAEPFEWQTDGDHLMISGMLMVESWTFTIEGDILTLDSRQTPGVAWSYIRAGADLGEAPSEGSAAEHAEELLGTWIWDGNDNWIYAFHADGTGTRGENEADHFEWWTEGGDHLIIATRLMEESWTFTIEGDILTLDSRQTNLTWRYTRGS